MSGLILERWRTQQTVGFSSAFPRIDIRERTGDRRCEPSADLPAYGWLYRRGRFRNHHEFGRRTRSKSYYLLAAAMLAVTLRVAPISCVLAPVLIATADPADRSVIALD